MQFGIKKGSSKEITLEDISKGGKEKLEDINSFCEGQNPNTTEIFIETCYELAQKKNMTAAIHLDHSFIVNDDNQLKAEKVLNVLFRKQK